MTLAGAVPAYIKIGGPAATGGIVALAATLGSTEIALGVVSGIVTLGAAIITNRQSRNDRRADREEKRTDRHELLIDQLQEQLATARRSEAENRALIERQDKQIREHARRLVAVEIGADRLVAQLVELGADPVWRPEQIKPTH
ncbi:MAG: hypothetical protein AAGA65_09185 [Actinomycetota bacterium]